MPFQPVFFRLLLLTAILILAGCSMFTSKDPSGSTTAATTIRVGIANDAPPLAYSKNSAPAGLEPRFAAGLAGFMNRRLELVQLPRKELFSALREKKIDIIMAGITVAEAARHQLAATAPYLATGQTTLLRLGDYGRLGNGARHLTEPSTRLGVINGSTADLWVRGLRPKGVISRFATAQEAVQALMKERIDVFIGDQTANYYYAAYYIDKGLTPGNILLTREELAWAVRPGSTGLRETANKYLAAIQQSGELQKMLDQGIPFYRNTAYSPGQ